MKPGKRQGEMNGRHILTRKEVERYKRLYKRNRPKHWSRQFGSVSGFTISSLAVERGVSYSAMQEALSGITWK